MAIQLSVTGVDSTLQDTATETYVYTSGEVHWGCKFDEMLKFQGDHKKRFWRIKFYYTLSNLRGRWIRPSSSFTAYFWTSSSGSMEFGTGPKGSSPLLELDNDETIGEQKPNVLFNSMASSESSPKC